MKKSLVISVFVFLLFCIGISAFAVQLIMHDCLWWECAPERNFRIVDLEIPSSLFPDGAIVNHVYPLSDEHQTIEDGVQGVFWRNGGANAGYTIYRYPTAKKAIDEFEFKKHGMVNTETGDVWKPPAELTFSSTVADTAYVACGYRSIKRCAMVGRYQEYVVFFIAVMDEEMTYSKFESILVYIDKQMSSRLYP
jgi:hypothetical protein